MGDGEEHGGRHDLPGLHALQGEARKEAAPAEGRVFEDHGTRPGDLSGNGEALDEPQHDEQDRRQDTDLSVGRQQADRHGREPHQEHAKD